MHPPHRYALLPFDHPTLFLIVLDSFLTEVEAVSIYLRAVVDNDTLTQSRSSLDTEMKQECHSAALILQEARNHRGE